MSELEMKINALIALCTTDDEAERASMVEKLKGLASEASETKDPSKPNKDPNKPSVAEVLLDIGVPDAITGHRYLVYAIECAIVNPELVDKMVKELYPKAAQRFGTTGSRVERAIRHGIECAWDRADLDVMAKYFGNTISISKGKPTNSQFIARIANYLRA